MNSDQIVGSPTVRAGWAAGWIAAADALEFSCGIPLFDEFPKADYDAHAVETMRINTDQMIAGYPAPAVRQLMRETLGRAITTRWVCEVLRCPRIRARTVLHRLEQEGWIVPVGDHLEPSLQGSALAQATAARALTRATADRLISELLRRVVTVNREDYAYRVQTVVVFGSYVTPEPRPNDVDIGVRLSPRYADDRQIKAEERRRKARGANFASAFLWAAWPKIEILRFLKSRSRGLSIQEISEWIEAQNHKVLYEFRE